MANKRGQPVGTQRGNRQRFPYEPRVIAGKLMMPAELQTIHRYVIETPDLENVSEGNQSSHRGCLARANVKATAALRMNAGAVKAPQ
jgi:hypothetical protein